MLNFAKEVAAAKTILIGGAGPVAMDMVAQVRNISSATEIVVVFRGKTPMGWNGTSGRILVNHLTKTLGVKLLSNERLVLDDPSKASFGRKTYRTESGKEIEADICLPFFGVPRTGFLEASVPGALTDGGKIKTDEYGQSVARKGIFAVGVSDKFSVIIRDTIEGEAKMVAANISSFMSGEPEHQWPQRTPKGPMTTLKAPMHVVMGLGEWCAQNHDVEGAPIPAFCGRCCGCCNPLCPCCICWGWAGMHPSGYLAGRASGVFLHLPSPHNPHKPTAPEYVELMSR